MPERNDDVSIRFFKFLASSQFPKRATSCRTMHCARLSFVDVVFSRLQEQASQASPMQSFLWSHDNAEQHREGGEEPNRAEPLPQPLCGWDSPLAAGAAAPTNEGCLHPLLPFYPAYCKSFLAGKSFGDYAQRSQFGGLSCSVK